ncbi:Dihydroxy-acid dehydratase [Sphingobacterium daejeonense]|uniref:dihydroxy-acid dehydratase domain-containing protein n=1 Tax=Sphingobacterium daejeonense TaxID=371142 RepID=UPI0010C59414|nr:dihydroxy-acid dehydratase [Sphingobacterium daejeonense]VTQ04860.1 Dihydroxy-acid dehydratase [Sphingobacterium daejeonense]
MKSSSDNQKGINKYSRIFTQDETTTSGESHVIWYRLTDADMEKAQVGIASMGYDGNTCNMHLNDLAQVVKKGIWNNGLVGLTFGTIGVSDGMSNGTDGMRYSLVSRDVIADSIETICGGQYYDGVVLFRDVTKICRSDYGDGKIE